MLYYLLYHVLQPYFSPLNVFSPRWCCACCWGRG